MNERVEARREDRAAAAAARARHRRESQPAARRSGADETHPAGQEVPVRGCILGPDPAHPLSIGTSAEVEVRVR
jgi:hypothetical protein